MGESHLLYYGVLVAILAIDKPVLKSHSGMSAMAMTNQISIPPIASLFVCAKLLTSDDIMFVKLAWYVLLFL